MSNTAPPPDQSCYHCGAALPPDAAQTDVIAGRARAFCCSGCQAIALTIHGEGLGAFYARRVPLGPPATDTPSDTPPPKLAVYDDPALLSRFTRELPEGERETTLHLDNIRCAACLWLNEHHLKRQPGVRSVEVNYVTRRARVRYASAQTRLSSLLQAVSRIGYAAVPFEPSQQGEHAARERRGLLMRLGVAMLSMMQVMMYAWPAYSGDADLLREHASLLGWASFALTLPVMFYSVAPIFRAAAHSLKGFVATGRLGMDVPVALALVLSFGAGTLHLISGSGETYFDSVTMFVALLLLARYLELRARHDAVSGAEALSRQLPAACEQLPDYPASREGKTLAVVHVRVGEILRVPPGDVVPADGQVVEGETSVDESLLTGEARPVVKGAGDAVVAGSLNLGSPVLIKVTAIGQATRLSGIARLLDQALADKPPLVSLAERWAGVFVVALIALSLLTGIGWAMWEGQDALPHALAVLVVSCPCALSLATPAALAAAQGALTRAGVLVVKGHALEAVAKATDLVLDKTGTLTTGRFTLTGITPLREGVSEHDALAQAAALEAGQRHPIAAALQQAAATRHLIPAPLAQTPMNTPGKGVSAGRWRLGAAGWVGADHHSDDPLQTRVYLADEAGVLARFDFTDTPREGAEELIEAARAAGLAVQILSGDAQPTVTAWGQRLGVEHAHGALQPEEKQAAIHALQQKGRVVWAVGDGVNDAPQLAQADISVAIHSGAPLAQAGADAVLMGASLKGLATFLTHARKTRRIIRQNLAWALAYNLTAIPAAMLGWIGPWEAAIGMSASSLLVTLNAWRLRRAG